MKKISRLFLMLALLGLIISGCYSEKISYKEQGWVEAEVVDKDYRASSSSVHYNVALKMPMVSSTPARYRVTLNYNGNNYTVRTTSSIYDQLTIGDIVKSNYISSYDQNNNFISDTMSFELLPSKYD